MVSFTVQFRKPQETGCKDIGEKNSVMVFPGTMSLE